MEVSSCCGTDFYPPGYPDNDICSGCGEHSGVMEEDFDDEGTWKEKEEYLEYKERRQK